MFVSITFNHLERPPVISDKVFRSLDVREIRSLMFLSLNWVLLLITI